MLKIDTRGTPGCGVVFVAVPSGEKWSGFVGENGDRIISQWLPAAYVNPEIEGHFLIKPPTFGDIIPVIGTPMVETGAVEWLDTDDNALTLKLNGSQIHLSDKIVNKSLTTPREASLVVSFEDQKGIYPFFSAQSEITAVSCGDIACVARVRTPLCEAETGEGLFGAAVYYDVIKYKQLKMVDLTACFTADNYAIAAGCQFARVQLEPGCSWVAGLPIQRGDDLTNDTPPRVFTKFASIVTDEGWIGFAGARPSITDLMLSGDGDGGLCQDIREITPANPFYAHMFFGKEAKDADLSAQLTHLPYAVKPEVSGNLSINSGALEATFEKLPGGLDLVCVKDTVRDVVFLSGRRNTLFTLVAREPDMETVHHISSLEGWKHIEFLPIDGQAIVLFTNPIDPALSGISVQLTAHYVKDGIAWDVDARNENDALTIVMMEYPRLNYDAKGAIHAFSAYGCGRVRWDQAEASSRMNYKYPGIVGTMQYLAAWYGDKNVGLYYGIHDNQGAYKYMYHLKNALSGLSSMQARYPAEGITEMKNSQRLPGQAVWQVFQGDWYDATMIYRKWALQCARWMPELGRADSPAWMRDMPMWWCQQINDDQGTWADDIIEATQDIGVPCGVHTYQWHQIPFDNDYPHYAPAKLTYLQNIRRIQDVGVKVMPYINARLWDTHDMQEQDWQFSKVARRWASTVHFDQPYTESYMSLERDGNPVRLAAMCPVTATWQEKVKEICNWLMNDIGVDAVYLDQIAAAEPVLCVNKEHGHRPGGGSWWYYGYYNLMEHLRMITPKDHGYTTEANAEPYMRIVDSYLSWHWVQNGLVPAFSAVYAGYIAMFGRSYTQDPNQHLILGAQSLLFGDQIGWITPRLYLDSPHRAFLRKIARARHELTEYLSYGTMLRPVAFTGTIPELSTVSHLGDNDAVSSPAALGAMWKTNATGDIIMILVNIADQPLNVHLKAELTDEISGQMTGDLSGELIIHNGKADVTLPAYCVVTVKL